MDEQNPYLATQTVSEEIKPEVSEERSIGGWLYLPLLGLILTPYHVGAMLVGTHLPIFTNGSWEKLTVPGGPAYDPMWAPLLIYEVVGNLGCITLGLVALTYFLKKSRTTPKLMIAFFVYGLVMIVGDELLTRMLPARFLGGDHTGSNQELARAAIGVLIWVPYFLMSKRVKETFVRVWPRRPTDYIG